MARTVITDAGFWIGLLDERDQYAREANAWHAAVGSSRLVIPWPCVYEVLSTRMTRREGNASRFAREIRNHILFDDSPYRTDALEDCSGSNRALSLVDCVIRRIICDTSVRKHDLITFNPGDFADVCSKHRVSILSGFPSHYKNQP